MKNILAFDTTSHALVMGLQLDNKVTHVRKDALKHHSEKLFSELIKILPANKNSNSHLHAIAVGVGPGSFTGIRVGLATAKTLSLAWGVPCLAFSSLHAIAYNLFPNEKPVCVVQQAKKNQFYVAVYSEKKCISKPSIVHTGDFLKFISKEYVYTGTGLDQFSSLLKSKWGNSCYVADRRQWYPQPRSVMKLVNRLFLKKNLMSPEKIKPAYLYKDTCNVQIPK